MSNRAEPRSLSFVDWPRLRRSKNVGVKYVLASPCYLAIHPARIKFVCQFLVLFISGEEKERQPFVSSIYGGQLRSRVPQHCPLLIRCQVSRSCGIVCRRGLAHGKHAIPRAERCLISALSSLNFIVLLGRPVCAAPQARRISVIIMKVEIQIEPAKQ